MKEENIHLKGLSVHLNRLIYRYDPGNTPPGQPHIFIYFLTISNQSDREITLLSRKWIIETDDGNKNVVEGDKIVGETPTLKPGESFSYNSFHLTSGNGVASGSYHGIDEANNPIRVCIPKFELKIPEE